MTSELSELFDEYVGDTAAIAALEREVGSIERKAAAEERQACARIADEAERSNKTVEGRRSALDIAIKIRARDKVVL